MTKVSIIGYGWVGKAMKELFPSAWVYVRNPNKEQYDGLTHPEICPVTNSRDVINQADIAFICVPSPLKDGVLDISYVEECVSWCGCPVIVVRSTVNPGTCDMLAKKYNKRIVMQPEYLGETPNHPLLNQKKNEFMIIGGAPEDRRVVIEAYTQAYNASIRIRQVTAYEAEIIKLAENRAIAFKVMQCQELYDVCEAAGVDYYTIRDAVYGDDPRFNLWFTFIYPEKRGFDSSKCLVKDVPAFCAWASSVGYSADITKLLVHKSTNYRLAKEALK